jgi:hypothetical protein
VREAFGPMMHRFEEIFHAQWNDQECFMQMLLGAARPLRLLPYPSRLYRESKIPRDKIQAVIYGAGSVAQHLHHRRAITGLLENQLSDLDDVPSINEAMQQLEAGAVAQPHAQLAEAPGRQTVTRRQSHLVFLQPPVGLARP